MKSRFFSRTFGIVLSSLLFSAPVMAVDPGDSAPDFKLDAIKNYDEPELDLASYKGKVLYVDFWASWCGPCQKSFPVLNELRASYKDKGFEVIGVNLDERVSDAGKFLKKYPVDFPIVADESGEIGEVYKVKGMPSGYIVDKTGIVRKVIIGFDKKEKKEVSLLVAELVKE